MRRKILRVFQIIGILIIVLYSTTIKNDNGKVFAQECPRGGIQCGSCSLENGKKKYCWCPNATGGKSEWTETCGPDGGGSKNSNPCCIGTSPGCTDPIWGYCTSSTSCNPPANHCDYLKPTPTRIPVTAAPIPTATVAPSTVPPQGTCPRKGQGDTNCDGKVDGIDYSLWLNSQCRPSAGQTCADTRADFNKDGNVDDADYQIWFTNRGT